MTVTRKWIALCGFAFFGLVVLNVALTTDGPRPNAGHAAEVARITTSSTAIRLSAVLGELGAIAFCGLTLCLAAWLVESRRVERSVAVALSGVAATALMTVSFGALAAAAQSATTSLGAGAVLGLGHLHTTTLILTFVWEGMLILIVARSGMFGRVGQVLSIVVGLAAVLSLGSLMSPKLDEGPLGLAVVIAFWGVPLWTVGVGIRALRPYAPKSKTHQEDRQKTAVA